jgi:hypothetical protein
VAAKQKKRPEGWWRDPESGVDPSLWTAYEDFRVFLFIVWRHLNLPDPTPIQNDIARYLQKGPKRRMIQAFRGVGKSWITVAYVIWRLLREPDIAILVVSASKLHAESFTTFCMRIIYELEMCQHLIPKANQRNSKIAFDVGPATAKLAPSVKSVGITGQITGSRADLIVPDDIEIPNNSETQLMRDKLSEQVKEFDAVLKPDTDESKSEIIYLGTPQNEQSTYNVLSDRGYAVRIWPVMFPDEKLRERMGSKLAPFIAKQIDDGKARAGQPTEPKRFTLEDLEERRSSYGKAGFSLQFMLDTSLSDAEKFPLKVSDLIVMSAPASRAPIVVEWSGDRKYVLDELPSVAMQGDRYHGPMMTSPPTEWVPFDLTVMFIDPSGRGKDETGFAIVRLCQGMMWLVASGGFIGGYSDETLQALSVLAKRHNVNVMLVEPNFGDGMFTKLLAPVVHKIYPSCTVEDADRANTQKEARIIDTLEPVMMQHKLVVDPAVIESDYKSVEGYPSEEASRYRLFHQMTRITRDKGALGRDDRLDALAGAVAYLLDRMGLDAQKQAASNKDRMRREQLERFMEHAIGHKEAAGGWSSDLHASLNGGGLGNDDLEDALNGFM